MPIKGENGGYKYKAFINGEWHDLTLSESPNEVKEWLKSNEEWARVEHGHWITDMGGCWCSVCNEYSDYSTDYCPNCGAKMDEVEDVQESD